MSLFFFADMWAAGVFGGDPEGLQPVSGKSVFSDWDVRSRRCAKFPAVAVVVVGGGGF